MSSPQTLSEFVHQTVLPRLAAETAYQTVRFSDTAGRFWRGTCPFHAAGPSWPLYVDRVTLRWSCPEGCHKGGQSVLAFLAGGHLHRLGGDTLQRSLQLAAEMAGLPSPIAEFAADDESAFLAEERVASLLETFFLHAYLALRNDAASPEGPSPDLARKWLEGQRFDLSGSDDLPIGMLADGETLRGQLVAAGFSAEEIDASALADDPRLAGRLVGPIRDRFGRILSFWARHPDDEPPRFLYKGKWKDAAGVFGLDHVGRSLRDRQSGARNSEPGRVGPESGIQGSGFGVQEDESLLVVQQILDAIFLQSKGLASAVAIGGLPRELDKRRWQRLAALGVRRVVRRRTPTMVAARSSSLWMGPFALCRMSRSSSSRPRASAVSPAPRSWSGPRGSPPSKRSSSPRRSMPIVSWRRRLSITTGRTAAGPIPPGTPLGKRPSSSTPGRARGRSLRLDRWFVPVIVAGLGRTWDTLEPLGEEPPVKTEPRPTAPRRRSETCPIHGCDETTCFCFD